MGNHKSSYRKKRSKVAAKVIAAVDRHPVVAHEPVQGMRPWAQFIGTAPSCTDQVWNEVMKSRDVVRYDIKLSDYDEIMVHETNNTLRIATEVLSTEAGRCASRSVVGEIAGETITEFAYRTLNTAVPRDLYLSLLLYNVNKEKAKKVSECAWLSIALTYAKTCQLKGVDINKPQNDGYTMLTQAAWGLMELSVYWLMRRGASPVAKNIDGSSALSMVTRACINKCPTGLHCPHEQIKYLLLTTKDAPHKDDEDVFERALKLVLSTRALCLV